MGKAPTLSGMPLTLTLVLDQQIIALEHLEGVGGRGPEQVGLVVAGGLLQVLDAGGGLLLQHLHLTPGYFFSKAALKVVVVSGG